MSDFAAAMNIIDGIYDAASLHMLYENDAAVGQRNLYTSIAYGRAEDMRSVPERADLESFGRFTVLRKRLTRADASRFIEEARTGDATIDGYDVAFELSDEKVEGFRPGGTNDALIAKSPFSSSLWTRERIGCDKRIGETHLALSTIWALRDHLAFLEEPRWSPIVLPHMIEKIGDLDEWWPTPVLIASSIRDGHLHVSIPRNLLPADLHASIKILGTSRAHGLETASIALDGPGPFAPIALESDGTHLSLLVGNVTMDRQGGGTYIKMVGLNLRVETPGQWNVPARPHRPGFSLPANPPTLAQTTAGSVPSESIRLDAWVIGDYSRNHGMLDDSERVYDPVADSDSVRHALDDLRSLGSSSIRPRVRVADPYALDEKAMEVIAAIAARNGGASTIELFCGFKSGKTDAQASLTAEAPPAAESRERSHAKQREQEKAEHVAELIKSRIGISTVCYEVTGMHDRFLMIDERLWHIGPSLNGIGEEFGAIVEMRDPRRIADVVAFFERNAIAERERFRK